MCNSPFTIPALWFSESWGLVGMGGGGNPLHPYMGESLVGKKNMWKLSNSSSSLAYPCLGFTLFPDTYIHIDRYICFEFHRFGHWFRGNLENSSACSAKAAHFLAGMLGIEKMMLLFSLVGAISFTFQIFQNSQVCSVVVPGRAARGRWWLRARWFLMGCQQHKDTWGQSTGAQAQQKGRRKPEEAVSRCGGAALAL